MSDYVGMIVAEGFPHGELRRVLFELPPHTHVGVDHMIIFREVIYTPVMDSITESKKYDEDWFKLIEKLRGVNCMVRPDAVYSKMKLKYPDEPETEEE